MRNTPWLLLALLAQVAGWLALWAWFPCWHDRFREGWQSDDLGAYYVDLTDFRAADPINAYARFDFRNKTWGLVLRRRAAVEYPRPQAETLWEFKNSPKGSRKYVAQRFDTRTLQTIEQREVELPPDAGVKPPNVWLHANRFLIELRLDHVHYWDLTDPECTMQMLTLTNGGGLSNVSLLDHNQNLLIVERYFLQTVGPTPMALDAFRLSPSGQYEHVRSWTTIHPTRVWGDKFVCILAGKRAAEVRSAQTDELLTTIDLPVEISQAALPVELQFNEFGLVLSYITTQGPQYFDVLNGRSIKIPSGWTLERGGLADGSLMILRDRFTFAVWDSQREQVLWQWNEPSRSWNDHVLLLDRDTLLCKSRAYGITFELFDAQTGKLKSRYQPFRLAIWCFIGLMIVYPCWIIGWARASAAAGIHPGIDVGIIMSLPLAVAWMFTTLIDADETQFGSSFSVAHYILLGISIVALCITVLWAISSTQPFPWRYMPWATWELVNMAGVLLWVKDTPRDPLSILWHQHTPLLFFVLGLQVVRMSTRRLVATNSLASEMVFRQTSLSEFFMLTAAAALVLGVSSYATDHSSSHIEELVASFFSGLALLTISYMTLSSNRVLFGIGCLLGFAAAVWLTVDAGVRWIGGFVIEPYIANASLIRTALVVAAGLFAACLCFRLHGYYLTSKAKGTTPP